ncbi:hypothetical protein BZA70DRAFT_280170 [Myxozyma melibiosi]|uniref:Ubiquitin carboxyl-terminal hydrolase n=1 Tax=Myxozyma melibiosi TaxID=54550 RepID=A0ABR1F4V3_9ASCO
MTVIPLAVRHAGKKYDLEVDLDQTGEVLKFQLYSLTGVDPERQKVLVKGGQLKDETVLNTLGLKPNQTLMMLGTAGELPKEPVAKMTFVEDLTDRELAQATKTPIGLVNLGNTCYLNSSLQCLRTMPELEEDLSTLPPSGSSGGTLFGGSQPSDLAKRLRDLYRDMKNQTSALQPLVFLNTLRMVYPQFAEQGEHGRYKQQDAEEAFTQILSALNQSLTAAHPTSPSFVDSYMSGEFATTMTCAETDAEPPITGTEKFAKLACHITGETNFLSDGLQKSLEETIEKHSDVLGRDAAFTLKKRITRLPKYLVVHFMRFYWRRDTQKKSKILRKVQFPFELDVTDLCEDELKTKLVGVRDKVRDLRKAREEKVRAAKRARTVLTDTTSSSTAGEEASVATPVSSELDAEIARLEKEVEQAVDEELKRDKTANSTGLYELVGVISHSGKSADSGHYQFWSKQEPVEGEEGGSGALVVGATKQKEEPKWWRFNDDKVTVVEQTKIETMMGGGESDSALILLYRSVGF